MLRHQINPGLELRLLQPADAPALFALVDANRKTLRTWLPWVDATTKPAHSQKFIAEALRDREKTRAFACGIWASGELVGVIWHNRIDWAARVAFPAYWLVPSAEGRGIMRAACQAVIAHAFNQLRVDRVIVAVATENHRAASLVQRLGFTQISTLKKAEWLYDHFVDHHIYQLLNPSPPPLSGKPALADTGRT
jgi:ribosomal-protein-serine acetyltransferase